MYKWILLCIFTYGCKSSSKTFVTNVSKPAIVYQLPKSVTKLLAKKIKGNDDSVYFQIDRDSISFSVDILQIHKTFSDYRWIMSSNHKLKIGKRLFPIMLSYDSNFGTKETSSELILLAKSNSYYSYTSIAMTGEPYYIKFDSTGKILYAGR